MSGFTSTITVCLVVLAVVPCLCHSMAGARLISCEHMSCYPTCCSASEAEELSRQTRASANMMSYLMNRPRGVRSLDMIDAPSFGGSRTFGGFGYNTHYNPDSKRGYGHGMMYE